MIKKMEERRRLKGKNTAAAKKEYRKLNNELRRETEKAREQWWNEQCEEIESLQKQGKHDKVYNKIRQLQKKKGKNNTIIKDKNGELLTDQEAVRIRWKEYVEELYDSKGRLTEVEINEEVKIPIEEDKLGPGLLREEVERVMGELKNGKAECIRDD